MLMLFTDIILTWSHTGMIAENSNKLLFSCCFFVGISTTFLTVQHSSITSNDSWSKRKRKHHSCSGLLLRACALWVKVGKPGKVVHTASWNDVSDHLLNMVRVQYIIVELTVFPGLFVLKGPRDKWNFYFSLYFNIIFNDHFFFLIIVNKY